MTLLISHLTLMMYLCWYYIFIYRGEGGHTEHLYLSRKELLIFLKAWVHFPTVLGGSEVHLLSCQVVRSIFCLVTRVNYGEEVVRKGNHWGNKLKNYPSPCFSPECVGCVTCINIHFLTHKLMIIEKKGYEANEFCFGWVVVFQFLLNS